MISIAKNIEDKCSKTRDNLNSLMLQVNQTEVKLSHATNQFSAVEQVKFVENRVEEDDESFYGLRRRRQQIDEPRKEVKPEDGDERTMDDLIQLAVERSIEGMYNSYEKVTLQLTDSESSDEDDLPTTNARLTDSAELTAGKATIMRAVPKYPFIERPLPHVIGSKEWQNKWHVGLIDSDEESSSDRKEEYSESSSETDDGGMFPSQPNSKNHTPSESESSIWGAEGRKRAPSMDPSITGDDGSSVYSYASSSKVPRTLPVMPTVVARGITSENARLKPPSLFPDEPPGEDGGRRGDRGLFDDSPEEDEQTPIPTPQPRQATTFNDATKSFFKGNTQQPARRIVNLFDDEPPEPLSDSRAMPEQKKSINLFIDSEEEKEQVMANVRNNNANLLVEKRHVEEEVTKQTLKPSVPVLTNPRAMTKLVDELNNNFRKQQEQPVPVKTKTAPEETNMPRASLGSNQRPTPNIFDDEPPVDVFDQLFNAANANVKPTVRQTVVAQSAPRVEKEKKPVNLFAEDDEDDYGAIVVGSNEMRVEKPLSQGSYISPGRTLSPKAAERLPSLKKKSIFDDSDSEGDKKNADSVLFGGSTKKAPSVVPTVIKAPSKVSKSIFSDSSETEDDDDEALFGKSSSVLKGKLDALKKNGSKTSVEQHNASSNKLESKPPGKSKSLFDEDSEEDLKVVEKDEDLFGGLSKPSKVPLALDKTAKTAPHASLFDDDPPSDDDDTLFGKSSNKPGAETNHAEKIQRKAKPSHEPVLVGTTAISVGVDVFSNVEPSDISSRHNETVSKSSQPTVEEDPVASNSIRSMILKKSIFNSDSESEEDDTIFGTVIKSTENSNDSSTKSEVSSALVKTEMNQARMEPQEMKDAESNEQNPIVEEELKLDDKEIKKVRSTLQDNNIAQNTLGTVNLIEENEPPSNPAHEPVYITSSLEEVTVQDSIREKIIEISTTIRDESDQCPNSKTFDEITVSGATLASSDSNNDVAEDVLLLASAIEESSVKMTNEEPAKLDDKSLSTETPSGMMIANDIEYYLHTNEPSKDGIDKLARAETPSPPVTPPTLKSEPKSALTFSPIGLFDDVPPPDDDDDRDAAVHLKKSVSVESAMPPIMDDASSYSTESRSLNFIPSGSAGGNRSRYLFDDEPPPDEADNSNAIPDFGEQSPFKMGSSVVKGLFDNAAPTSLPAVVEDSRTDFSKPTRPKINKLNTKLAINVAALLPGARRPTPISTSPEQPPVITSISKDPPISDDNSKSIQSNESSNSEKLAGLNKGRARIPTKRKPPSRGSLRASSLSYSLQSSLSEEERVEKESSKTSAADDRIVVGSEGKIEHIEAGLPEVNFPESSKSVESVLRRNEDSFVDRLSASVRHPTKRVVLPDGNESIKQPPTVTAVLKSTVKPSNKSLFSDSDSNGEGDDDFFSKLPAKGTTVVKKAAQAPVQETPKKAAVSTRRSIFGSDDEDNDDSRKDDLFGTKKSSIAVQLKSKDVSASQTGTKKEKISLFDDDDEDEDDDDDLFGSKNKTISKANSHHQQSEATKPSSRPLSTVTKPKTTTTQPVDDPLADLLADS
uniref:CAP-ZIP_m domain-containing protein n=1 Tax=Anopheles epiroticus TaxID=199890 RepID=A0A182P0G9_9DIPT